MTNYIFYKNKAQELINEHRYTEAFKFIQLAYEILQKKNNIINLTK